MRCVRRASSSLLLVACVSLLFLHAGSVSANQSGSKVIRIWTVGSPHTGALPSTVVPPELRQRAEGLGYTIEVEAFRAGGFAAKFHQALQYHTEPEILTFDNYGVISGIRTVNGWVDGIDSDRRMASSLALVHETLACLQPRGWVMLVRSAVNYEAARAFSMPTPECEAQPGSDSTTIEPTMRLAQEKAVFATRAYLDCDRAMLSAISDESRLVQQCFLPKSDTTIGSVKACRVAGNHKLAFVSLVSGFSAQLRELYTILPERQGMDLGQKSILAVLRNQGGSWRLLAITHDPVNTVAQRPMTRTNLFLNSLDQEQRTAFAPDQAQLLTPDGVYPLPQRGERFGDFIWQPSQSNDVIGQIVEFMWGKDTNWGLTRLFFLPPSENKLSSGYLMSGGATMWRVWSINKAGDVTFSDRQSFTNR